MGVDNARKGARGRSHKIEYHAPDSRAGAVLEGSISGTLAELSDFLQQKAMRSAARAGALVFYNEMKIRSQGASGGPKVVTGTLSNSIFHFHDNKASVDGKQVYLIGPNKREAPHWFNVEYGHFRVNVVYRGEDGKLVASSKRLQQAEWVPPYSYIRSTWDAKQAEFAPAVMARLKERIAEFKAGATE